MKKETLTAYTNSNGTIRYYNEYGDLHNANGPAVIWPDGGQEHWINDQLHNPNGPAIVWANGYKEYYINGEELSEAEFKAWQTEQSAK
jgi:hypothetical protein